jgi:hypothetical protein
MFDEPFDAFDSDEPREPIAIERVKKEEPSGSEDPRGLGNHFDEVLAGINGQSVAHEPGGAGLVASSAEVVRWHG